MKDADSYFRGACNSCECQEYANDGGIKCADCKCPASRHKLSYWKPLTGKSDKDKSKPVRLYPLYLFAWLSCLNPFAWIALRWINPFAWIALRWISIWKIRIPMMSFSATSFNDGKNLKQNNKFTERIKLFTSWLNGHYQKLWTNISIIDLTKMPNIDSNLLVEKFQKRLFIGLAALLGIFAVGILGFRGSHLNYKVLNSLYSSNCFY